jgi:hypothetical protein
MKMAVRQDQLEMISEDESPSPGDLRRGPWTAEEDLLLVNYIAVHGEGRWNALARCAGWYLASYQRNKASLSSDHASTGRGSLTTTVIIVLQA